MKTIKHYIIVSDQCSYGDFNLHVLYIQVASITIRFKFTIIVILINEPRVLMNLNSIIYQVCIN